MSEGSLDFKKLLGPHSGTHKPSTCPSTGQPCAFNCTYSNKHFGKCLLADCIEFSTANEFYEEAIETYQSNKDMSRGVFTGFPQSEKLDYCALVLYQAFHCTCYQVGSTLQTKKWRDVDVRMIMPDENFNALFGTLSIKPFWGLLCSSISEWMSKITGLPVDFQIQSQTTANKYSGPRNALGIGYRIVCDKSEYPTWLVKGREQDYE